jgi:hypothetical protein
MLFTSLSKLSKCAGEKPFSRAKPAYVDFSSSDFYVQGHTPSTSGDTLRASPPAAVKWPAHYLSDEELQSTCTIYFG